MQLDFTMESTWNELEFQRCIWTYFCLAFLIGRRSQTHNRMFLHFGTNYCKCNIRNALIFVNFAQNSASANSTNPRKCLRYSVCTFWTCMSCVMISIRTHYNQSSISVLSPLFPKHHAHPSTCQNALHTWRQSILNRCSLTLEPTTPCTQKSTLFQPFQKSTEIILILLKRIWTWTLWKMRYTNALLLLLLLCVLMQMGNILENVWGLLCFCAAQLLVSASLYDVIYVQYKNDKWA